MALALGPYASYATNTCTDIHLYQLVFLGDTQTEREKETEREKKRKRESLAGLHNQLEIRMLVLSHSLMHLPFSRWSQFSPRSSNSRPYPIFNRKTLEKTMCFQCLFAKMCKKPWVFRHSNCKSVVLWCVFEHRCSKTLEITGVVSEVLSTAWCINLQMLIIRCVFDVRLRKNV